MKTKAKALNRQDRWIIMIGLPFLLWALTAVTPVAISSSKENGMALLFLVPVIAILTAAIILGLFFLFSYVSITPQNLRYRIFIKEKRIEWSSLIEMKYPILNSRGQSTPLGILKTKEGKEYCIPFGGENFSRRILSAYTNSKSPEGNRVARAITDPRPHTTGHTGP